ncbi:MAG: hypothetical protein A2199_04140 [Hydrogenophilales bacterium RIFOXYA1_FULL_63_33]|nr:MAG: hypothetical protein A2199_04140 [Hydrogenophilales bacterium RIFOXYA1_FULL_63_33]
MADKIMGFPEQFCFAITAGLYESEVSVEDSPFQIGPGDQRHAVAQFIFSIRNGQIDAHTFLNSLLLLDTLSGGPFKRNDICR